MWTWVISAAFISHNVLVGMVFPEDAGGGYSDDEGGGFECLPTPTGEKSAASQKVGWTNCTYVYYVHVVLWSSFTLSITSLL